MLNDLKIKKKTGLEIIYSLPAGTALYCAEKPLPPKELSLLKCTSMVLVELVITAGFDVFVQK